MKELIKIEINENQEPIVNGRELYEVLGVSTRYNDWFNRMKDYGFVENQDYCTILKKSNRMRQPIMTMQLSWIWQKKLQ